jgi:hypothetical protein
VECKGSPAKREVFLVRFTASELTRGPRNRSTVVHSHLSRRKHFTDATLVPATLYTARFFANCRRSFLIPPLRTRSQKLRGGN